MYLTNAVFRVFFIQLVLLVSISACHQADNKKSMKKFIANIKRNTHAEKISFTKPDLPKNINVKNFVNPFQIRNKITDTGKIHSKWIKLNYANAAGLIKFLENKNNTLLSAHGLIYYDKQNNSLWIKDTDKKIHAIEAFVRHVDQPIKQVQIQARIVNVDKDYEKELGARFGVTVPGENLSGTLSAASALAQHTAAAQIPFSQRLNVDLPSTALPTVTTHGSLGLALARLSKGVLLDLELSAMEKENHGRVISSPRVVTANRAKASIETGEQIPYQQVSLSGGTSIAFKKAVLGLEVTPEIMTNNKILLHINVHQDRQGSQLVANVPTIDTRHISTQVLMQNAETLVLGGIYQQDHRKFSDKIPVLGDVPVLGAAFRHQHIVKRQLELLIFITPTIIRERM